VPHLEALESGAGAPYILRLEAMPERVQVTRARSLLQLATAKFLQTVFAGILIILAGYLLFEAKFIGTLSDVAGIFLWGFGLDITTDTLLQIIKIVK
jgi:uncharacterized membrane protein